MFNPNYRLPSLNAFNRLIPSPVSIDYEKSLRAEIHDPLWFLARQWQMGEFLGEDAGAPAFVRVETSQVEPVLLHLDASKPTQASAYNFRETPLEPLVEREPVMITVHMRVQAGYYFQKLLRLRNLGQFIPVFVENFPLPLANLPSWDSDASFLLSGARGNIADGMLIAGDFQNENRLETWIRSKPALAPSTAGLLSVAGELLNWIHRSYPVTAGSISGVQPPAWKQEQLEYRVSLEMLDTTTGATAAIVSDDYADGQLDWPDFNWSGAPVMIKPVVTKESYIPTPVHYQGMPNARYWEMEEGRVNFGKISMSPANILSMSFAEFGLSYSNDWFYIPMNLKINSVCKIDKLEVTNVFGDVFTYPAPLDTAADPLARFNLFSLMTDQQFTFPVLYLPPSIAKVQEGEPLERVYFMRDEQSNLAWAIESIVPSLAQTGIPVKTVSAPAEEPVDATSLVYKLGDQVPENWTPFLPVRINNQGNHQNQTRLQRARMPGSPPPKGAVLQDKPVGTPYFIREEEVSRAGVIIERNWQRARWLNGKTFCWIGRKKTSGRLDTGQGLRWDYVSREK